MGALPDEEALMLMVYEGFGIGGEERVERGGHGGERLMMDVEA
jgi:hypothetical protein